MYLVLFVSIASYDEKSAAPGAKKGRFCMGILVTLGLSTENAVPRRAVARHRSCTVTVTSCRSDRSAGVYARSATPVPPIAVTHRQEAVAAPVR